MANVVGLFPDERSAEQAITDLKAAGFDPNGMGFVARDKRQSQELANDQGVNVGASTAGAVTGAAIGGTLGAILAATGALVIPGIGPFISGGILATSLVAGAAGWLVGGLVGLGVPENEAKYYQGRVEQGGYLVTLRAGSRADEAWSIMLRDGAEDLRQQGYTGVYGEAATTPATGMAQNPAYPDASTAYMDNDVNTGRRGTVDENAGYMAHGPVTAPQPEVIRDERVEIIRENENPDLSRDRDYDENGQEPRTS